MILNQAQAEAVYTAIVALNNVSGGIRQIHLPHAVVSADASGAMHVYSRDGDEHFAGQLAFALAYGLS